MKIFEIKADDKKRGQRALDWSPTRPWDVDSILSIEDISGANISRKITSYPSPLARIHLFNDAFDFARRPNFTWDPTNIYVQTISHCLDVWELMFHYEAFDQYLNFEYWGFDQIEALKLSPHSGHRLLGSAFELYLTNDHSQQFSTIGGIYIITYKNKAIAGTSPFTGFFTTAATITEHISVPGNPSRLYFNHIRSLEERDIQFQVYFHQFILSQGVSVQFENLYKFVSSRSESHAKIHDVYNADNSGNHVEKAAIAYTGSYDIIGNRNNQYLTLLDKRGDGGIPLRRHKQGITEGCEFFIKATVPTYGPKEVLALKKNPEGKSNKNYASDKPWDMTIGVPYHVNEENLRLRRLPGVNIIHPWVGIGDFLEEYLVKLPYDINDDTFLTGAGASVDLPFLLPIKQRYFEFFTAEDLKKQLSIIRKSSTVNGSTGETVDVELKIPIQTSGNGEEHLIFRRRYQSQTVTPTVSDIQNSIDGNGAIVDYYMGLMLFPFLRTRSVYDDFSKIGFIDSDFRREEMGELKFFRGYQSISNAEYDYQNGASSKNRSPKSLTKYLTGSTYYQIKGANQQGNTYGNIFDWIQFEAEPEPGIHIRAAIIPNWAKNTRSLNMSNIAYAVDFGTTNTHVAYRVGTADPRPFSITEDELLVTRLDKVSKSLSDINKYDVTDDSKGMAAFVENIIVKQRYEFIPSIIGGGASYSFVTRTGVSQAKNINQKHQFSVLGNINIAFALNKRFDGSSDNWEIHTNIKWSPSDLSIGRMESFITELLYLMRYKTIINNGNPANVNLSWFVPLSMNNYLRSNIQNVWNKKFQEIFHVTTVPTFISESEAPFYELLQTGKLFGSNILCIDIGGGTTDTLVIQNVANSIQYHVIKESSFTYAGNAIFGHFKDESNRKDNGFVRAFKQEIQEFLKTLGQDAKDQLVRLVAKERLATLEWYLKSDNEMRSEDIINFFFSVNEYEFDSKLRNSSDFKIVFMFYFAALHYHCAQIFKEDKLGAPTDVNMTGNGSRLLNIISTDKDLLNRFTTAVYSHVLEKPNLRIELHQSKHPKEATSNGALWRNAENALIKSKNENLQTPIIGENLVWANNEKPAKITYQDVFKATLDPNESEYFKFLDFFFDVLYKKMDFRNNFNIQFQDPTAVKDYLKKNSDAKHTNWVQWQRRKGANPQEDIKETMFFYAVMDGLSRLLEQIADRKMGITTGLFGGASE